ncbi:hypothetical protein PMAYCL1PPCAC_16588, partial [Pristionchus mayeri]
AHGAKRVLIARTSCSKVFWVLLMLALYVMVVLVVVKLTDKYWRHDRITSIAIKFDEVEFPAITFCNLNPYKRSLVRLIPSVRDTMDVYDNAKSTSKVKSEKKQTKFKRKDHIEKSMNLVKELFREELGEEEERLHNLTSSDSSAVSRVKRESTTSNAPQQIYEAIEAHCRCLGKPDMECIRFTTPPKNDKSKCICTLNMEMDKAWPCFNATIWHDHICPVCSVLGTCEAELDEDTFDSKKMIFPEPDAYGDPVAGFPCTCRNRSHYEGGAGKDRPYCVRKHSPVEIRRLWIGPTLPPPTTTPPPTAASDHVQRPIVTAPETIKAMGFSGMTDGVAMLTKAKENIMFTMAALSLEQRVALSQDKREFIEMCSFNGKECEIEKDFKLHVDPEFGNCYTFNYDPDKNLTSSRAGPMYGIRVLLFVNTSDYMSTSESAGVRLAIHPATQYPFPDTFGYSAPVGFASSFGIKKQKVVRLAGYGDCTEDTHLDPESNVYDGYEYNPEGCHRSCFQNRMIDDCDCGDPRFPVPTNKRHCSAFNATARKCLESKIGSSGDFHHMTPGDDDCVCKHACSEVMYSMSFSTSKWPSGASDLGDCEDMTESECLNYYRLNAAMVEVYYEQLNYQLLQESEAYGIVNLIADFGGHLGLWMGFSVI